METSTASNQISYFTKILKKRKYFVTLHAPIPHNILFILVLPFLLFSLKEDSRCRYKKQREFLVFHFLWAILRPRGICFHHSRLHNFIISGCNKQFPVSENLLIKMHSLLKFHLFPLCICTGVCRNHTIIPLDELCILGLDGPTRNVKRTNEKRMQMLLQSYQT